MKKFKLIHKTGKIFKDKRGSLQKILEGEFSSCIEVHSKKEQQEQITIIKKINILCI